MNKNPGMIVDMDELVEDGDEDWNLKGIMGTEEIKASGLQGKVPALQQIYCFTSVEVSVGMQSVVILAV